MSRSLLNVFALLFLISVQIQATFLSSHSTSSSSTTTKLLEKLQNPKFVKANGFDPLLMSTISLKLKASSGKLEDVLALLDELDKDLTTQQETADYDYNLQNAQWSNSLSDIATQISDLSLQINSDEERILELTSELTVLNQQLDGFNAQNKAFSDKREALVDARQNDIQAYTKRVSDQNAMLDALTQIVDMLEAKTTPGNFAEIKSMISSNLRKFKETAGPYATLVGLTLSFDPEVVKNILDKLKAIQGAIQASIEEDDEKEVDAKLDYNVFLQSIDDTLAVIAANLKKCQKDIFDDNFELTNKQEAVEVAKNLVDTLSEQKKNIENARDAYNAGYDKDKQERNYEINTVRAAEEILNSHSTSISNAENYSI